MQFGADVLQNFIHIFHPRREVPAVDIRLVKLRQIYRISHEFWVFFSTSSFSSRVSFQLTIVDKQHTSISGSGPELPESAAASSASAIVILLLMAARLSKCLLRKSIEIVT